MEESQIDGKMENLALATPEKESPADASVPQVTQLSPSSISSANSITTENPTNEESVPDSPLLREWKSVPLSEEEVEDAPKEKKDQKVTDMLRKGAVAVTGGALVVAGLPLIPCPAPGGVVVVGSGMAILATEFPAAQRALDKSREGLENMVQESDDEAEEGGKQKKKKDGNYTTISSDADDTDDGLESDDEVPSPNSKRREGKKYGLIGNGTASMPLENRMKADLDQAAKNLKQSKRNVKRFVRNNVLPIMSRVTSKKDNGDSNIE